MTVKLFALIQHGIVWELAESRDLWTEEQDVRDVSDVEGIAAGWVAHSDGTYAAPPPLPDPPASEVITYKADLYRRCTDAEADSIEMALTAAPTRQRRLFESAQFLNHADPEFTALHEAMVGMFGAARTDVLLAAS